MPSTNTMKPRVSPKDRQRILQLRRTHSYREVAATTGMPLGTIKTICSRSAAFRDNQALRELFRLPEPILIPTTALAVPEPPPHPVQVTGDNELDAVLWLRQVIGTGQAALIAKAMEAFKRIKTPADDLERRYSEYLMQKNSGNTFAAAFGGFEFANLEGLARRSVERLTLETDALARFGSADKLFAPTPAEQWCMDALKGLKPSAKQFGQLDAQQAAKRFMALPDRLPQTLSDCLYELAYWHDLYRIRHAVDGTAGDSEPEAYARECFVFASLARIRPRSTTEAIEAFRYLPAHDRMDATETPAILNNLISTR